MNTLCRFIGLCVVTLLPLVSTASAQDAGISAPPAANPHLAENAEEVAKILGITQLIQSERQMREQRTCESPATPAELSAREDILETETSASLDVDAVLAEIESERARLSELNTALQARQAHSANLLGVANLVTGTGLGIVVNAMQFKDSTAIAGDGLGVGSGVLSTILSVIGLRQQRGPVTSVGQMPNMLAQPFGRPPALNSYYPDPVLDYLHTAPPDETSKAGSRLDQLMAEWRKDGRLLPASSARLNTEITKLTSSLSTKTKLSSGDISNRIAMLDDVAGRVAPMKRDLADLMLYVRGAHICMPSVPAPATKPSEPASANQSEETGAERYGEYNRITGDPQLSGHVYLGTEGREVVDATW